MKCSCLVIPRLWSHSRCTCHHPDHSSQQPTSHKSMKKVTVPARRIHNTSHQSTSVAACHMREKRWEGDKSEKGHSIVRTSTSIDQTNEVLAVLLVRIRTCCSSAPSEKCRHVMCSQPIIVHTHHRTRSHPTTNRSFNTPTCHTHDVRWRREGERKRDIVMTTSRRPIKPSAGAAGAAGARG